MNIKTKIVSALLLMGAACLPAASLAQEVNNRLHDQNARIRQGIHSGQLTRREARMVRHDDKVIHARERLDRLTHNGHLTAAERTRLNNQLNRNSTRIYRDKHNPTVRH